MGLNAAIGMVSVIGLPMRMAHLTNGILSAVGKLYSFHVIAILEGQNRRVVLYDAEKTTRPKSERA